MRNLFPLGEVLERLQGQGCMGLVQSGRCRAEELCRNCAVV